MNTMTRSQQSEAYRQSDGYQTLKHRLHRFLILQIEEQNLDIGEWSAERIDRFIGEQLRRFVGEERVPVNQTEAELLVGDVRDELVGYGPIQSLVDDDGIDDIVVNGPNKIFIERAGRLYLMPIRFADDNHVIRVIQRILAPLGRRVDESTPMVDARLPDGSRVNAVIPPIALDGPCVSIRKFRKHPLTADDLVLSGTMTDAERQYLRERVAGRTNVLVIGGTGSGKTTMLNVLSQWITPAERVITIEDAAELRLDHGHVVRLETRPANLEGDRAVSARDLVRNALRMRPDRIIVGEVRGDEVLEMLQAMNTGHEGSMTTLHANSPRDALHRIELLAGFAGFRGNEQTLRSQIAAALHLIVHVSRLVSGQRRILSIAEMVGLRDGQLQLVDLFRYEAERGEHRDLREAA